MPKPTVAQRVLRAAQDECAAAAAALHEHKPVLGHILDIKALPRYVTPEQATDAIRALHRWAQAYLDVERLEYPDTPGNPRAEPRHDAPVD